MSHKIHLKDLEVIYGAEMKEESYTALICVLPLDFSHVFVK